MCAAAYVRDDMTDEFVGIRADAVDEVRLPAAQERQAEDEQAWHRTDAAVVIDATTTVEGAPVEPRQARPVTRGPDDGTDRRH